MQRVIVVLFVPNLKIYILSKANKCLVYQFLSNIFQSFTVDINQDEPNSNAIHVAHNIPTGSDITVVQTRPYNTSVHISLNIAKDCKVI